MNCTRHRLVRVAFVVVFMSVLVLLSSRPAFAALHTCKPVEVATYAERIHVRCAQPTTAGIVFFAVSTANSAHAARILSSLLSAHTVGKNVVIEYDAADTSGTAFGCAASDCRRLLSVAVE